jgi:ATP-dependent Clp protease adaptor protein ClpS
MSKAEVKTKIKPNLELQEPTMFKVIYTNDDVTTIDFVVETLIEYFNHSTDSAAQIANTVHETGSAVVAIMPYEIAEQKGMEVTTKARNLGFPLVIKLESDD